MTDTNAFDRIAGKFDCLQADLPDRDYTKLGSKARRRAEARIARRREMGVVATTMIVALVLIYLAPSREQGPLAVRAVDSDMPAMADTIGATDRESADEEIAVLFVELDKCRARQSELERSWEEYRQRENSLAVARRKVFDQYLDRLTSSNLAAGAILTFEKEASTRRPVDRGRLQAIIQLYPDTSAAAEAGRLLANHN